MSAAAQAEKVIMVHRDHEGNLLEIILTKPGESAVRMTRGGNAAVLPISQWFACMRECFPKPDGLNGMF